MIPKIEVRTEVIPAYAVLHLSGFVNTYAEEAIEEEVRRLLDMRCPYVLLDFGNVEHINSAGITILIGLAARVQDQGGRLGAYGLNEHYRKIFRMVGLEEFIRVGSDREVLLEGMKSPAEGDEN